jgi:hypothetical protein
LLTRWGVERQRFCYQTIWSFPGLRAWYGVRAEGEFLPYYFFDLTDKKIIHDFKGKKLADVQSARQHALGIAFDLVSTGSPLLQEPLSSWSITVKDGKFQTLFSIPVADQTGTA